MKTLRKFLYLMVFLFFVLPAQAQEAPLPAKISYQQYLEQVLVYYPSLKKEQANIEKAIAQKALAGASRLPHLWLSAQYNYGNDPVYVFGALLRQNKFTNDDLALGRLNKPDAYSDNSAGVGGEWLLFDFAQTSSRVKSAGLLAESASFQGELTRMEAILAASEIYSRLAVTQQFLELIKGMAAAAKDDIASAESLSRQGLALGADFYTARIYQTRLEQLFNETTAQHAALSMVFNVLRGADPSLAVEVALDLKKPLVSPGTVQEWIAKTSEGRLDIKVLNKILEAQDTQQDSEKKSFLPKIVAFGRADDHQHSIGEDGRTTYVAGLAAKMDIFDPSYASRVKIAQEEVNRLKAQTQELKDQSAKDTAEMYYRLHALSSNAVLADRMYNDSQEAVRLMQPLYREGRANIFQMIGARLSQVEAYERWLKIEAERRQSLLTLTFYAGELNERQAEAIYGE